MPGPLTTSDLLSQVRAQIDESNTEQIGDSDIIAALNRAQRKAANILCKHYVDFFMTFTTLVSTGGIDTYDIPEGGFGRRLNHVVVLRNSIEYPLRRVTYRDLHKFASATTVRVPSVYAVKGRQFIIKPTPSDGITFKMWYPAAPETVVLPQGRITAVNAASNYLTVDAVGSSLTTDVSALGAFVNIADNVTGVIKATVQLASISGTQLTIKTSGLALPTVYNRTVATSLPVGTTSTQTSVNVNDYVCGVQGTCVPDLPDACTDFMVQYGVYELRRRLGEPLADEKAMLDALEADVKSQWAGRELNARIMNKSRAWTR